MLTKLLVEPQHFVGERMNIFVMRQNDWLHNDREGVQWNEEEWRDIRNRIKLPVPRDRNYEGNHDESEGNVDVRDAVPNASVHELQVIAVFTLPVPAIREAAKPLSNPDRVRPM